MSMKGQSAIEYLVTYGWMVLAVAIVGGVAYNSVSGSCSRSFTGFYADSVSVGSYGIDAQGNFKISLENNEYQTIKVERFNVSSTETTRYKDLSVFVGPGESTDLKVPGYSRSETCQNLQVKMVFDRGPLEGQVVRGTIEAPISVDAVQPPNAPYALAAQT